MIQPKRIVLVLVPAGGIAQDVFADRFQFVLVSDYMFVVVALPDRRAQHAAGGVHSPGGYGFEILHDRG
jgi:hypothetical protein